MSRDPLEPLKDPRPGDVLIPKLGLTKPCLVMQVVDVLNWHQVYYVQPFASSIGRCEMSAWKDWMRGAEVLHVAQD